MRPRIPLLPLLLVPVLAFAGCGSPDFSYFESITSGPNPGATLILVWLSDAPADDADRVEVTIERVELIGRDGTEVLSTERRTIDLLTLQNGNRLKLAETEIPNGNYETIRLILASQDPFGPEVEVDGATHPLVFSNAGAHVIDVPYTFHAPEGFRTEVQVDFNVRMSIAQSGNTWVLTPHVDAVSPEAVGAVAGRVVDPSGNPIAGATVVAEQGGLEQRSTRTAPDGTYRIDLLLPGVYDVSVIGPLGPTETSSNVLVGVGMTTPVDFGSGSPVLPLPKR